MGPIAKSAVVVDAITVLLFLCAFITDNPQICMWFLFFGIVSIPLNIAGTADL